MLKASAANLKKSIFGFTIIELIVVIGVIGTLATISIIGYGSWRASINLAQIKSDLSGAVAAFENYRNFNNAYPSSVPSSFSPSSGTTMAGGSIDGKSYCVSAAVGGVMYRSTNTKPTPTVTTNGCIATKTRTTPGAETWTIPTGVTSLVLEAWGASGAGGETTGCGSGGGGGAGGYSKGTLSVTSNTPLYLNTGAVGGAGAGGGWAEYDAPGGAGGGASDIRYGGSALANRKIVAGGGGGGGGGYDDFVVDCYSGNAGGAGGGTNGNDGSGSCGNGIGGTQSSGDATGVGTAGGTASGGGGGGYYGGTGAGSGCYGIGGGGGSGYIGGVASGTMSSGVWSGNGKVVVSYYYPDI